MILTKQQKLDVYTYLMFCCMSNLESVINGELKRIPSGFCGMVANGMPFSLFVGELEELYSLKPKYSYFYWWPIDDDGYRKRIEALEKAIQLTEQLPE